MSSREIAELLGSRRDSVKRTVERLAERGVVGVPPLAEYKDTNSHRADLAIVDGILPTTGRAAGGPLTMSSREIAELLGSRHDDVKRSIERLVMKAVFVRPPLADEPGTDRMGRPRPTCVYLLDKRSSLIVVAQLSPEFTARVVDRWQELEEQVAASRHDNVKRTIESLVMRAVFVRPQTEDVQRIEGNSDTPSVGGSLEYRPRTTESLVMHAFFARPQSVDEPGTDMLESRHDTVKASIERLTNRGVIEFPAMQEIPTATKPMRVYLLDKRSSREIADMLENRHDTVKVSIERLAKRGTISIPSLAEYRDTNGRRAGEYLLDKRSSLIVVAQLSPELLGARHDNVKVTVRRLMVKGIIGSPALQEFHNINGVAGTEYRLDKRSSLIVVAQLSPELLGARHDHVKVTVERVAQSGAMTLPPLEEVSNTGFRPSSV